MLLNCVLIFQFYEDTESALGDLVSVNVYLGKGGFGTVCMAKNRLDDIW